MHLRIVIYCAEAIILPMQDKLLTTIYNYRSRVRNNALGDKEKFEQEVMKL